MSTKRATTRTRAKTTTSPDTALALSGRGAGVWIDGEEAMIISLAGGEPTTVAVKRDLQRHKAILNLKYGGVHVGTGFVNKEAKQEAKLRAELTEYLDRVIGHLKGLEHVVVFGPAQTKTELGKRLAEKLPGLGCDICTTAPMSKNQKVAWVKRYFRG